MESCIHISRDDTHSFILITAKYCNALLDRGERNLKALKVDNEIAGAISAARVWRSISISWMGQVGV